MRLEIDLDVANDPEAHRWLDRILSKVEDGWHVWDTTHEPDPNAFTGTTWISQRGTRGDEVRELLIASVIRSAWSLAPHGRRLRVRAQSSDEDQLAPEPAARCAETPLTILVENRCSDGLFLTRIVAELDRALRKLWNNPHGAVQVDSVGGKGQMAREVRRRVRSSSIRPRLVAIIDSDRRGPECAPSREAGRLLRECERANLPCWILEKREAENYLPRVLLDGRADAGSNHMERVEVWDWLSDEQKDFFSMKDGLPSQFSAVEQTLFGQLPDDVRAVLSHGFGENVYKCWNVWGPLVETELRERGRGDLERGLELIRREV